MPELEFTSTCNFKKRKALYLQSLNCLPGVLIPAHHFPSGCLKLYLSNEDQVRNNLLKHCLHMARSVLVSENRYGVKGFKISRTRPHCTLDTVQSGSEQFSHSQVLGDYTAPLDHDNLGREGCLEARSRGSMSEGLHLSTLSVSGVQRRRRSPEDLWLQILK